MSLAPGALPPSLSSQLNSTSWGLNESLWHTWIHSKHRGWSRASPRGPTSQYKHFAFWPNYGLKPNTSGNLALNDSLGQQGHYPDHFQISLYCFFKAPKAPFTVQHMAVWCVYESCNIRGVGWYSKSLTRSCICRQNVSSSVAAWKTNVHIKHEITGN